MSSCCDQRCHAPDPEYRLIPWIALVLSGAITVALAVAGAFRTGSAWSDLLLAGIIATLGLSASWQAARTTLEELRYTPRTA